MVNVKSVVNIISNGTIRLRLQKPSRIGPGNNGIKEILPYSLKCMN